MSQDLKEITVEVARQDGEAKAVDVYLFDGAKRIGRYQVRTNADGRRDVYHSDIENGSFTCRRKLPKAAKPVPCGDSAVAAIAADLADRGLSAPALDDPGFSL
ncbi:MAG: hypothetical protein IJG88_00015 [Eggerthellaceae bacterium]|nr:hypothetical protein [Eggerthellaceae bacterium]